MVFKDTKWMYMIPAVLGPYAMFRLMNSNADSIDSYVRDMALPMIGAVGSFIAAKAYYGLKGRLLRR